MFKINEVINMTERTNGFDYFDDIHTMELAGFKNSLDIGLSSVIGKRKEQQDTVLADDEYVYYERGKAIATLCDGMGGLSGGKLASSTCASILNNAFHDIGDTEDISLFYRKIIQKLDKEVRILRDDNGKVLNSGTTLISVAVNDGKLYWISVGDSRIYLIRKGRILCITHDHNYSMLLKQKVLKGQITKEEAENDPQKDALISYIGMGGVKYIDINTKPFVLADGDCLLLCSDGLYRTVDENEMLRIINSSKNDMRQAASSLTECAIGKNKKGQDNTSVITIQYNEFE